MGDDKQTRVLKVAKELFNHYGFRKTTMNDIAIKAEISRQTLYGLYPNKEAVLRGAMIEFLYANLEEMEQGIQDSMSLKEQLEFFCERVVIAAYTSVYMSPHTIELGEAFERVGEDVLEDVGARHKQILASIFAPYAGPRNAMCMTAEEICEFFLFAARGLKEEVKSLEELRPLLTNLIKLTAKALEATLSEEALAEDDAVSA